MPLFFRRMKLKNKQSFVTNSSSTSFIIRNTSDRTLTIVDFVKENPQLIEEFKKAYSWKEESEYNQTKLIQSAENILEQSDRFKHFNPYYHYDPDKYIFAPGEEKEVVFGDEDGTLIGSVFDYILRDGGTSPCFTWRYNESLR